MDDESKQLLTAILSRLGEFQAETKARFDRLETKVDNLETKVDGLETKVDGLEKHAVETNERLTRLESHAAKTNERFDLLEKQVSAIGFEVKEDVRNLLDKLDRLPIEVFTARADSTRNRVDISDLNKRVTALEERQAA